MSKRNTKERGASTKVNKPQMKSFEVPKPRERNPMERKNSQSHVTRRLPEKKEDVYAEYTGDVGSTTSKTENQTRK